MASKNVMNLIDANFEAEVLKSSLPVLVDFWAPWCGPCRVIGPIVEELADSFVGRLKVGKVNVDEAPHVAASYQITSIPTLLIFKNGMVVDQLIGAVPKKRLEDMISRHLT